MRTAIAQRSREPLGAQVADAVRARIARGDWSPGATLPSESALAEEFGVSQRVIRDALRALSNQGIIQTSQGKRATVAEIRPVAVTDFFRFLLENDPESIDELLELRSLIESRMAMLAAENASDDEIGMLALSLAEMQVAGADADKRVVADLRFHRTIAAASRNRYLMALMESLAEVLEEERRRGAAKAPETVPAGAHARHEELKLAIEARDPERAAAAAGDVVQFARVTHRGAESS